MTDKVTINRLPTGIPGLDEVPYFTNETIFDVSERIQHLIVLGGGPVGLELAQAHRMLGSHVTVFDTANFLAHEDPDAVAVLIKRLADTQVVMHPNTRVERVERSVQGVGVHFMENGEPVIIKGTHLLVATTTTRCSARTPPAASPTSSRSASSGPTSPTPRTASR